MRVTSVSVGHVWEKQFKDMNSYLEIVKSHLDLLVMYGKSLDYSMVMAYEVCSIVEKYTGT